MTELRGQLVPETEEEWDLLKAIYDVTGDAYEAGMEEEEIAISLHFAALSILAFGGEQIQEAPSGPSDDPREDCPGCGTEIEDVEAFIGGDVEIRPCGCTIDVDQVPGWIDQ